MFFYFRGSYGGLSDLGGIHMPPVCFKAPYVWTSPYVWMPHMFGHPHMFRCPQNVWWHPNIREASKHMGVSKPMGHPNIQGVYKHRGHMDTPYV